MTTTAMIQHTVTVAGKPIFFAEAGDGPSVVMLPAFTAIPDD
jgi:4,5:9,10-diseco-3-hydroxy-5,9,17-trioxoandrosta-1(10),2-diene-4-oate hydrolase